LIANFYRESRKNMHLHLLTLKRLIAEIAPKLIDATITASYTQVKNEWILSLSNGNDIHLSCQPQLPYLLLTPQQKRVKNSTDVLTALIGQQISDISVMPGDRIVLIRFLDSDYQLYLQLFTANSQFLLCETNQVIIDSFKQARKLIGTIYEPPQSTVQDVVSAPREQFIDFLRRQPSQPIAKVLRKLPLLNRLMVSEILVRCSIAETSELKTLSDKQLSEIQTTATSVLASCMTDRPRVYFQNDLPFKFALTDLQCYADLKQRTFENINDALRFFLFQKQKWDRFYQLQQHLYKAVDRKISSIEYHLQQLSGQKNDPQAAERYLQIGQLITAQPHLIRPGTTEIKLVNYFDESMPEITVTVDPQLSAAENAAFYFNKARENKNLGEKRKKQQAHLLRELDFFREIANELKSTTELRALRKIEERLRSKHILQVQTDQQTEYRLPYKRYLFKGAEIWVGKSAADNDQMTFKHAAKEDFWLHVQGYAGSHVIIRNPGRHPHPPHEVLEYAARLAVTNSKAQHASYVPVIYTKVKYVRKPRKSPPGSVIPSQEKTIFADPLK
jgi:predicted ribosome quality control (RQC) complex YloA/Tae2 family protein